MPSTAGSMEEIGSKSTQLANLSDWVPQRERLQQLANSISLSILMERSCSQNEEVPQKRKKKLDGSHTLLC